MKSQLAIRREQKRIRRAKESINGNRAKHAVLWAQLCVYDQALSWALDDHAAAPHRCFIVPQRHSKAK
jgi:hypothetical protein